MGGGTQGPSALGPQTYRGFCCPTFVSSQSPHHSLKLLIRKFSFTSASEGYFKITGVTEIWSYIFSSLPNMFFLALSLYFDSLASGPPTTPHHFFLSLWPLESQKPFLWNSCLQCISRVNFETRKLKIDSHPLSPTPRPPHPCTCMYITLMVLSWGHRGQTEPSLLGEWRKYTRPVNSSLASVRHCWHNAAVSALSPVELVVHPTYGETKSTPESTGTFLWNVLLESPEFKFKSLNGRIYLEYIIYI